jgi:hypothetical protein
MKDGMFLTWCKEIGGYSQKHINDLTRKEIEIMTGSFSFKLWSLHWQLSATAEEAVKRYKEDRNQIFYKGMI